MRVFHVMLGLVLGIALLIGFNPISISAHGNNAGPALASFQSDATPTPDMSATLVPPPPATPFVPAISAPPTPSISSVQTIDDPARAVPIDNQLHKIAANSATWFSFNYNPLDPNNSRISNTITLVNASNGGMRFEVWTSDHMLDWWDGKKPVGQGTANNVACDQNQTGGQTTCQSTDLTWSGSFNTGGIYFVRIVNGYNQPVIFLLTIQ